MSEGQNEFQRKFIKERIVPRKKYKKILGMIFAALGLGILFGIMAAISFSVSQNILIQDESQIGKETIIIAQDDTEAETEEEKETEEPDPVPASSENSPEETKEAPETESTGKEEPTEGTIKSMYSFLSNKMVWLELEEEQAGFIIAKSDTKFFILTRGKQVPEKTEVSGTMGRKKAVFQLVAADSYTKTAVYSVSQENLPGAETVVLGSSFQTDALDLVYFVGNGNPQKNIWNQGTISYVEEYEDSLDGYRTVLYTNMVRSSAYAGALFNEAGELVGLLSDESDRETEVAVFDGISPMKKIIERLCCQDEIPYLGVYIATVTAENSASLNLEPGLYVQALEEGSPAYEAGLQVGDRILKVKNSYVKDTYAFQLEIERSSSGEEIELILERNGTAGYTQMQLSLNLGSR